jgi:hypothetical protein
MTEIYVDAEFLEDGKTIDLISVGMVAEDGREYCAVNSDANWCAIAKHDWLCENVVPSLPLAKCGTLPDLITRASPSRPEHYWFKIDESSVLVRPKRIIANEVREFILGVTDPQLWSWYGAYDHVVLCQLWGRMIDLPKGVPMWTNDLKQEAGRLGNPDLPPMPGAVEHDALHDAREVLFRLQWLSSRQEASA